MNYEEMKNMATSKALELAERLNGQDLLNEYFLEKLKYTNSNTWHPESELIRNKMKVFEEEILKRMG